jgi:hypothetical protein
MRFVFIYIYSVCYNLSVSITVNLTSLSASVRLHAFPNPSQYTFLQYTVLLLLLMAPKQKRRTPRNIYTEKHAEQEFQDFIQHSRLANLPIPKNLLPPSEPSQASKRQRLAIPEVCQYF